MQDEDDSKDEELVKRVNKLMENPNASMDIEDSYNDNLGE